MLKSFVALVALSTAGAASAETYAIQAGHLIVDAAQPERGPSTVIVENGRISRIESGFTAPAGATVIDELARTVLPGLIDAHVHLTFDANLPWYVPLTQKYSAAYSVTRGLVHAREMAGVSRKVVHDSGGRRRLHGLPTLRRSLSGQRQEQRLT